MPGRRYERRLCTRLLNLKKRLYRWARFKKLVAEELQDLVERRDIVFDGFSSFCSFMISPTAAAAASRSPPPPAAAAAAPPNPGPLGISNSHSRQRPMQSQGKYGNSNEGISVSIIGALNAWCWEKSHVVNEWVSLWSAVFPFFLVIRLIKFRMIEKSRISVSLIFIGSSLEYNISPCRGIDDANKKSCKLRTKPATHDLDYKA